MYRNNYLVQLVVGRTLSDVFGVLGSIPGQANNFSVQKSLLAFVWKLVVL